MFDKIKYLRNWFSTVDSSPVPMDRKKVPPTTARNPRELVELKSSLPLELSIFPRRIIMSPQPFSTSDMMGSAFPFAAFPISASVPQTKNLIYTCIYRFTSLHRNTSPSPSPNFQRLLARSHCPGKACRDGAKYLIPIT